ncbi:beta-lactamase/transpeptidase-like protein [Cladorrhinum sp. PSN332]|nr:beta-lactamase/transpeptidase-like protein [Cladorrhinum sp. PSN332]
MQGEIGHVLLAIEQIMAIAGVPGISIGIIHRGETAGTYHLGYRDIERALVADDDTRYNINSLAKGLFSSLVGIEVHRGSGQLDRNKPVKTWLLEFWHEENYIGDHCSIVDLLSHRSSISSSDDLWMGSDNVVYMDKSQVLPTFQALPAAASPFRGSLEYNNWGYEIVSKILERTTDKTISALLRDRLLDPLGMTRTSTAWIEGDDNEAKSYGIRKDLSPIGIARPTLGSGTAMEAAGGVKSSVRDLLVFFYKTFMHETNLQFSSSSDSSNSSGIIAAC